MLYWIIVTVTVFPWEVSYAESIAVPCYVSDVNLPLKCPSSRSLKFFILLDNSKKKTFWEIFEKRLSNILP